MTSIPAARSLVHATASRRVLSEWAPLPLRLIVGYGFMFHGYAKLSRGPETFATILHTIGTPAPSLLVTTRGYSIAGGPRRR